MKTSRFIVICFFIVWGVLSRTIFHLGPNIEFITGISIACGILIRNKKIALLIPILIMLISDMVIGNTKIFLFTWSAFLIPVLIGFFLLKLFRKSSENKYLKIFVFSELSAVISSLSFFVWTNFGHWLITNMYTKDLNGFISCYINAIPFLKPQLAGNLIIVPIFIISAYLIFNYSSNNNWKLSDSSK